mgnify:CR=1 FL=1
MSKQYNFCNNCGKNGHMFHHCKQPITSIGIIAFRYNKGVVEYLMIRRKDSLGFVDFMRGKYPLHNKNYLMNIINEMTNEEKVRLTTMTFDELWSHLWGDNIGIQYRGEEKVSRDKFRTLKEGIKTNNNYYTLESLISHSTTSWETPEWGYPKGRRNYHEKDLNCALREFEEETGYLRNNLNVIQNIIPIEEIFTGSNYKSYKHRYYLAEIDKTIQPKNKFQETEVSSLIWTTFDNATSMIRDYNLEKIELINNVNEIFTKYSLYI